jgi:hypothetical protein
MHLNNDFGETENVLDLPPEILKKRQVHKLDIGVDKLEDKEQRAECDTTKYRSELAKLGPLEPGMSCLTRSGFICVIARL